METKKHRLFGEIKEGDNIFVTAIHWESSLRDGNLQYEREEFAIETCNTTEMTLQRAAKDMLSEGTKHCVFEDLDNMPKTFTKSKDTNMRISRLGRLVHMVDVKNTATRIFTIEHDEASGEFSMSGHYPDNTHTTFWFLPEHSKKEFVEFHDCIVSTDDDSKYAELLVESHCNSIQKDIEEYKRSIASMELHIVNCKTLTTKMKRIYYNNDKETQS